MIPTLNLAIDVASRLGWDSLYCGMSVKKELHTALIYLIVGSGLSALVFGALMARSGQSVRVLEAHEYPGGFGHTFTMAKQYHFNAQLHYVWDCGEGHTWFYLSLCLAGLPLPRPFKEEAINKLRNQLS
jgi:hypothetical protein